MVSGAYFRFQAKKSTGTWTGKEMAGFPRNRGDIEEYRSRRVRMDGVVLVDFEEEALRQFLNKEVSSGALRVCDIETELERYKQDIISVAEYYDEKELLTVVMGDQDTEEMIEDMVIAVDKIIETRKDFSEEDSLLESKGHDCSSETPYKTLVPSPTGIERPSTVEIRDATEEDIKSIEAESRNSAEIEENISPRSSTNENKASTKEEMVIMENSSLDQKVATPTSQHSVCDSKQEEQASQSGAVNECSEKSLKSEKESGEEFTVLANASDHALSQENEGHAKIEAENKQQDIPILFAFENIKTDYDILKDLIVNEMEMCYINFHELIRNDDEEKGQLGTDESLNLLQRVLKQDSVSYSSGFFISDFPFDLLKESKFEKILSLGEVSFVCKVKEKSFETEIDEEKEQEEALFESPMSKQVRIIFVTESNIVNELKSSLQEIVCYKEPCMENSIQKSSDAENNKEVGQDLRELSERIDKEENVEIENKDDSAEDNNADEEKSGNLGDVETSQNGDEENPKSGQIIAAVEGAEEANPESISEDKTSRDDHEDSTCQDVDDLITDDTLNERTKPSDSLLTEENKDASLKENVTEDSLSQIPEEGTPPVDVRREKAVLARQPNLDVETTSASEGSTQMIRDEKPADDTDEKPEQINSITAGSQGEGMDGENQEVCEGPIENFTAQVASTESQEDGKDSGTENEASQDLPSVEEKKDATHAKESEAECVQDNDEEEENADQNERKETSNEQTETDNIENGSKSQENSEIENQIQTDEMKSNQINQSDNSASASKETKQEEDFGSEAKNERVQNDEDGEESEAKISDSPELETKEDDNSILEKKENDNLASESKEKDNPVSETKEDDKAKEDDNPASETKEDDNPVSETKEGDNPVSETKEGDNPVSETKEDDNPVSETKEDDSPVSETKEDDNPVSESKEDDSPALDTKEDDSPVSETKEDDSQVLGKKDENPDSATTNDENPMESSNVMNNEQDTSENDENEKPQDVSEEIDEGFENKNASTDKADKDEIKENSEISIEINNNEDENRNSQAESSTTDLENVENNKSEVEDSTKQGSAADIMEEATLNDIIADKTDNDKTTDKIDDGDTENKIGNGDSSDKMVSDEFGDKTDYEETLDKTDNEEFVLETDNEGPAEQANNGETDDQKDNGDLADKTGKTETEESTSSSNKISVHDKENSGSVVLKSMDNDSDSNDENGEKSITIETKAEVHAPDSTSPPLLQATEKKSENTSSTFDSAEVENDNDNEDSNFLKNELTFGNTDESQLTTDISVQNERFSGKIQERNGSGILDESRHEDHPELEQQERSSSSSRGEL
ncbi:uncharacterized protein TNIN_53551 [Trichonephila inaurata madagascariensis]|uniref:Uncharacterized protein n=1 Tax=Trichonephila inaurata madagascariensis TaxID=2747483 RepID=A0A8X7CPI6_9ARAC|nr:uncharacterized protein TNIN_53551 [Trichonephila inaurata madagascariensis]